MGYKPNRDFCNFEKSHLKIKTELLKSFLKEMPVYASGEGLSTGKG